VYKKTHGIRVHRKLLYIPLEFKKARQLTNETGDILIHLPFEACRTMELVGKYQASSVWLVLVWKGRCFFLH